MVLPDNNNVLNKLICVNSFDPFLLGFPGGGVLSPTRFPFLSRLSFSHKCI